MSNLNTLPLIDDYETTLSKERTGWVWTIFVKSVPWFTFPSWVTTYVVVDPGKSNMQLAVIDSYNVTNKTLNCTSITLKKWASLSYTQSTHSIWSIVRISNNYQFWEDLRSAVNTKLDDNWGNGIDYVDTTARDMALWGNGVATKNYRNIKAWSTYYNYNLSTGTWQSISTGTAPANASTTVAWVKQDPSDAQVTAGTDVGSTTATMAVLPSQQKKSISLKNVATTTSDANQFVLNIGGEDKSITQLLLRDQIISSSTQNWFNKVAFDSDADTWTDTIKTINSSQLKLAWTTPVAWTTVKIASLATEKNVGWNTTYTLRYTWTPFLRTWVYTISFNMAWTNGWSWGTAYARVYKNWVAFGTEQTTTSAYPAFVNKTENLSFARWDVLTIYMHTWTVTDFCYVNSVLITCDQPQFTIS